MKRHRLLKALAFSIAVLLASGSAAAVVLASKPSRPRAGAPATAPARALSIGCWSPALSGTMPARVYLPAGYAASRGRRYPVVYFLHGLPARPTSYTTNAFVASALASVGERAIVVAPQGARGSGDDREYLDWDAAEDWPQAIAGDLPKCIDARFRTIADRYGRALVGLSAGGYGAMNIGLRNLHTFGAVQSWSGYFVATDPSGTHLLNLGSPRANAAATVPHGPALRSALRSEPMQIAFYVGLQDTRFLQMNRQYDGALRRNRVGHVFHTYPGGHSVALWRAQARAWLRLSLDWLAARRHSH
ncbi:MAG: alpha/beta hydrolase [Solirubrobacteraceae bacterium]